MLTLRTFRKNINNDWELTYYTDDCEEITRRLSEDLLDRCVFHTSNRKNCKLDVSGDGYCTLTIRKNQDRYSYVYDGIPYRR